MTTDYKALDLGRYMKIDRILHTPQEDIDKQVQIVAVLADMTEDEVLHLPLTDYAAMAAQTAFLGKQCEPAEMDGKPITLQGMRLVPVTDYRRINTAQYVDFQTLAKDFPATIPELLSCFLLPEGKDYNEGYDIAEVHKAVLSLMLPEALGLTAFFLLSFSKSITDSLTSLGRMKRNRRTIAKAKAMRMQMEALLASLGDGLQM